MTTETDYWQAEADKWKRRAQRSYLAGALDSGGRLYRNGMLAVNTGDRAIHAALSEAAGGGRSESNRWILRSPRRVRAMVALWADHTQNEDTERRLLRWLADLPAERDA